jgi:transcriptional regulator with XRE-family HTH domain
VEGDPKIEHGRQRLGQAVRAARERVGLSQAEIAATAGVSLKTWSSIESPRPFAAGLRGTTEALIEGALGWKRGSVQTILDGGDPVTDPELQLNAYRTANGEAVGSLGQGQELSPDQVEEIIWRTRKILDGAVEQAVTQAVQQVLRRPRR